MRKGILLVVFYLCCITSFAQAGKKPATQKTQNTTSQPDVNKLLDDAMKDLTPEQRQMMKEMMNNQPAASSSNNSRLVPPRQADLLSKIPKFTNEAQLNAFVAKMKLQSEQNIEPAITAGVNSLMAKLKNNPVALNNLPVVLLMQKQVKAAVYASILSMQQNNYLLSKNNMVFMLQQAGYPQYALPVANYLLTKSTNPVLYNNAGQCYFSLGDTLNARLMLMACLKTDPDNAEAHCSMALMLLEQKKFDAAKDHIAKVFQNGYSHELEEYVTKKKIQLKFNDIKKKQVPAYFSPQKYKTVPAAKTLKEVILRYDALNELDNEVNAAFSKAEISNQVFNQNDANWQMKFVTKTIRGPFKRKAMFVLSLLQQATVDMITENGTGMLEATNQAKLALKQMDDAIAASYKGGGINSTYEDCKMKERHLVEYLSVSIQIQDAFERKYNYKFFDLVNENMYWFGFLLNDEEYKAQHDQIRHQVLSWIRGISNIQVVYPSPINIASACDKILDNPPKEYTEDDADKVCPFTLKIPFGIGSAKMNCNGWEIEANEIVALSLEKNYKTGDFTVAFGLGASAELAAFEAGVKGQIYFTVNDWEATDMGLRGEAKGEVNTGINPVEEGVKGAIGISGANANALHNGKEVNIFSYDPTK